MTDHVLQTGQFFRERLARGEDYEKRHKNGHADDHDHDDDDHDDQVRENPAHKNVFHRPNQ